MSYFHYDPSIDKSAYLLSLFMLTDKFMFFFPHNQTQNLYRKEKITDALGVVVQDSHKSGFVVVGETERQIVIQMDGQIPDVQLKVINDSRNGYADDDNASYYVHASSALVNTIVTVLASHGENDLPIASLPREYSISTLVKPGLRVSIPAAQRQHYTRAIAEQCSLQAKITTEERKLSALENEAATLFKSETGDYVVELQKETGHMNAEIKEFTKKTSELQDQQAHLQGQHETLSALLEEQRAKREETVDASRSEQAKQRMLKKVAAYELKKNEHKRMMDRINKLAAVYERMNSDRNGSKSYDGLAMNRRIDLLEEQIQSVQELSVKPAALHRKRIMALAENRRRAATCKELIKSLPGEAKMLETTDFDQPIPQEIDTFDLPPVKPEIPTLEAAPQPPKEVAAAPETSAKHVDPDDDDLDVAPAPKASINLDDDDDDGDDLDVKPVPAPKVDLDDDDDDDLAPAPAPAKPPISLDDDDI